MKEAVFKVWTKVQIAKQVGKDMVISLKDRFVSEEKGGPSDLIIPVVIIVMLIALAIVFREQLGNLMTNIFGTATDDLDALETVT